MFPVVSCKEGEILDDFYEPYKKAEVQGDDEDYVDLGFADPRDRHLAIQTVAAKENSLFKQMTGKDPAPSSGQDEIYHAHRLFRHVLEGSDLYGRLPLSVNADFWRSFAVFEGGPLTPESVGPSAGKKRAGLFMVTPEPIQRYNNPEFAEDNRELLIRYLDPDFEQNYENSFLEDGLGKKSVLLSNGYKNIVVGYSGFNETSQNVFNHDGKFFSRIKFRKFEKFLSSVKHGQKNPTLDSKN